MNREEQLKFCRICKNKVKDLNKGLICGITGTHADFEDSCAFFSEDSEAKEIEESSSVQKEIINSKAPMGKRFANHVLDTLFIYVIAMIFGFAMAFLSPDSLFFLTEDNIALQYLFSFVVVGFYYALFEALTGRTPAKMITKTKVINMDGESPDIGTILIRTLCRFIPFDALSFLFSQDTGWHDRLSGTRVVNV